MSFLDHLVDCNRHDMKNFLPLIHRDQRVGWVKRNLVTYFSSFPNAFRCDSTKIETNPALNTPDLLSGSMAEVGATLTAAGLTNSWRNEPYAVGTRFGECLFELERAVVPAFGVRGYGLHLTGFVRKEQEIFIWVPRRTADRPTYPAQLDNTVAGGHPAGLSLAENLEKECAEEAGLSANLVRRARPTGTIRYRQEIEHGLKDDLIFSYDLELPADFEPCNSDGEVENFELWPVNEVMDVVESSDRFKFNCNLVLIDFFVRHGLIGASHPGRSRLLSGLRGDLIRS